jgi:2-keto-4-pentenoate hydratase
MEPVELRARQIVEARRFLKTLDCLSPSQRPTTLADGYAIQRAAIQNWGDEIAGWKVGATAYDIQKLFGIDECIYGPVFKRNVFASPARLKAADFHHLMLESEFAFRLNETITPRAEAYSRDDVLNSADALYPAFEIVSPRFSRLTVDDIPQLVSDFCANGGVVLGKPCMNWKGRNLSSQTVRLFIDGSLRATGSGASVIGDPINALEWLVNALSKQGITIASGQFVITGATTGIHAPDREQVAVADFGDFGDVEIAFN